MGPRLAKPGTDRRVIDEALVEGLIAHQFPQWAHLPVRRVEHDGHDNRTFRLGDDKSVRLPSHARYEAQVEKEQRCLPRLAPQLPLRIPIPRGVGLPSATFPFKWSVNEWIEGDRADIVGVGDFEGLAKELASFLLALQSIDTRGGPEPGPHNFYRGGPLQYYHGETLSAIAELGDRIDGGTVLDVWNTAVASPLPSSPKWLHGDLAASNLLVMNDALVAVIDFGICGIGDPSCDLKMAWTFFDRASRGTFRDQLEFDSGVWARGRGWALWKCLKTLAERVRSGASGIEEAQRWVDEIVSDHEEAARG